MWIKNSMKVMIFIVSLYNFKIKCILYYTVILFRIKMYLNLITIKYKDNSLELYALSVFVISKNVL